MPAKGLGVEDNLKYNQVKRFRHSPESWTQMWVEDVFGGKDRDGKDRVKVETELIVSPVAKSAADSSDDEKFWFLKWSVTRL